MNIHIIININNRMNINTSSNTSICISNDIDINIRIVFWRGLFIELASSFVTANCSILYGAGLARLGSSTHGPWTTWRCASAPGQSLALPAEP